MTAGESPRASALEHDDLTVRLMRSTDLADADRLREIVGFNQTVEDWQRLLRWEPAGCFVVCADGRVVGTISTTTYGPDLAWVGMVLVDPAFRRNGIGGRLLDQALRYLREDRCVTRIGLDATALGAPLYDRFGFTSLYGLTRHEGIAPLSPAVPQIRRMLAADILALAELDFQALGVDRTAVIRDLYLSHPDGCRVMERDGVLAGYACMRPGAERWHLGPVVAMDPADADALLRASLAGVAGQAVEIDTIDGHPGEAAARRYGLAPVRSFTRMALGDLPPDCDQGCCYAIASPELG